MEIRLFVVLGAAAFVSTFASAAAPVPIIVERLGPVAAWTHENMDAKLPRPLLAAAMVTSPGVQSVVLRQDSMIAIFPESAKPSSIAALASYAPKIGRPRTVYVAAPASSGFREALDRLAMGASKPSSLEGLFDGAMARVDAYSVEPHESLPQRLTLRSAKPSDVPHLIELLKATNLHDPSIDTIDSLKLQLRFDPRSILVLTRAGKIIGMALTLYSPWASTLWHLAVEPASQGRGLGHIIADAAEARLRDRGTTSVNGFILTTNAPSLSLFRARGYARYDPALASVGKELKK